ncbi:MAG TPA: response regulator transcription factor [Terriglobales bacterium]|jgi:DNA-binding NarL/FixJ family response regulator|nr:response regulator transcription factor [Terriglobales bacterium]
MKRISILLADDHAVVIEGLRRILDQRGFRIVGAVTDGRALMQAAAELQPDVIITDVAMPLLNGIEAVRQIRQQNPASKVLFFTMHPEVIYARQALAAGACGYVLKSSAGEELIVAINEALNGRVHVDESIARALQAQPLSSANPIEGLTRRQREVLQLLAEGRQAKEIAATLNVSPKTVEFHKYRIMDMLGVHTVAELARYAAKHGLVE